MNRRRRGDEVERRQCQDGEPEEDRRRVKRWGAVPGGQASDGEPEVEERVGQICRDLYRRRQAPPGAFVRGQLSMLDSHHPKGHSSEEFNLFDRGREVMVKKKLSSWFGWRYSFQDENSNY